MWKRWTKLAFLIAVPVVLYLIVAERFSWKPRTLARLGVGEFQVVFSPDGEALAAINTASLTKPNGEVILWDARSFTVSRKISLQAKASNLINSIAFSPDGKTLAGVSYNPRQYSLRNLNIWDIKSGRLRRRRSLKSESTTHIAYWPNGKTITSVGCFDVKQWDAQTGKQSRGRRHPFSELGAVAFAPDGKIIAGAWAYDMSSAMRRSRGESQVTLWHALSGKPKRKLRGQYWANAIAFSPDGTSLAVGCESGEVGLWDARRAKLLRTLGGYGSSVVSVAFSPAGDQLVSSSVDGRIRLWRVQ